MAYCSRCGYGIGSQGHHDCCISKTDTYTRNGNRINNWEEEDQEEELQKENARLREENEELKYKLKKVL